MQSTAYIHDKRNYNGVLDRGIAVLYIRIAF